MTTIFERSYRYTGTDSHDLAGDIIAAVRLGLNVDAYSTVEPGKGRRVRLEVSACPPSPAPTVVPRCPNCGHSQHDTLPFCGMKLDTGEPCACTVGVCLPVTGAT